MKVFKSAVLAFGMLLFAHGATYAQAQAAPTQAAPAVHPMSVTVRRNR